MGVLIPFERIAEQYTKEDRNMQSKCVYCRNAEKTRAELRDGDVILVAAIYTVCGDGGNFTVPVRYCPRCGRCIEAEIET